MTGTGVPLAVLTWVEPLFSFSRVQDALDLRPEQQVKRHDI
jgi:hypothetical protein